MVVNTCRSWISTVGEAATAFGAIRSVPTRVQTAQVRRCRSSPAPAGIWCCLRSGVSQTALLRVRWRFENARLGRGGALRREQRPPELEVRSRRIGITSHAVSCGHIASTIGRICFATAPCVSSSRHVFPRLVVERTPTHPSNHPETAATDPQTTRFAGLLREPLPGYP